MSAGVSIVVPTFREAQNLEPLSERIFAAIEGSGRDVELLVVDDDSQDGTVEAVETLSRKFPVRLIHRKSDRGLSRAVLEGFRQAKYDRFVVLDADLQHPPEAIPEMLARLDDQGCDFVIATRYAGDGGIEEDWPIHRRLASKIATLLAYPLAPLSDPMSGFFAIRRETWERATKVDPIGYKIALELFVKGRCRQPAEVPIQFSARHAGKSKFGLAAQLRYAQHLVRLYRFRFPIAPTLALVTALVIVAGLCMCLGQWLF